MSTFFLLLVTLGVIGLSIPILLMLKTALKELRSKKSTAKETVAAKETLDSKEEGPAHVQPHPKLYALLHISGYLIALLFLSMSLLLWNVTFFSESNSMNGGMAALSTFVWYMFLSYRSVQAKEVGAAFFYGKALKELPSGPHFIPLGLMQIKKGPRVVQEFQCPGEPEKVQKTGDEIPLVPGMVRPIRVVTGSPSKDYLSTDILNAQMTITLSFFVQWAITNVLDYTSNYGSGEEVEKQVRDIGEGILAELAVRSSAKGFIEKFAKINDEFGEKMDDRFNHAGVHIIEVRLISVDLSHEVSKALADIPKTHAEAEQLKIKSEGVKVSLMNEGAGKASAAFDMLSAQAEGKKKIMDALRVSGDAVLASEAVASILKETDVLVMGQGGTADAMGLVKAAQSALNSGKTKEGV